MNVWDYFTAIVMLVYAAIGLYACIAYLRAETRRMNRHSIDLVPGRDYDVLVRADGTIIASPLKYDDGGPLDPT